jgi:hypothetical protein
VNWRKKSPGSTVAGQAPEKASFSEAGIRLESGWKPACHFGAGLTTIFDRAVIGGDESQRAVGH